MNQLFVNPETFAVLLVRVFLGFLFFFQGYDKIFNYKISGVIELFKKPLSEKGVPGFIQIFGAWFTSYVEFIGGLLLIFGIAKYYILYLLGLDLILASVAFGIIKPMWDLQFVFPRLVLLIFLLIVPADWDLLSFDQLLLNN